MEKILVASKDPLAELDSLKPQDAHFPSVETSRFGPTQLGFEGIKPCHRVDEVHGPAVRKVDDRVGGNDGPGLPGDVLHLHVLTWR